MHGGVWQAEFCSHFPEMEPEPRAIRTLLVKVTVSLPPAFPHSYPVASHTSPRAPTSHPRLEYLAQASQVEERPQWPREKYKKGAQID